MSRGHILANHFSQPELDDLLDEVLANPKIKQRLTKPFKLDTSYDVALLGSSAIGGGTVYFDRHLKQSGKPFGVLPLQGRWIDVKPPLLRHERLEQAIEDVCGWPYMPFAHEIAEHWEERLVKEKGFNPTKYEKMLKPFIKTDEHEKVTRVPTDMDLRPVMSNSEPEDKAIFKHYWETAQKEKKTHRSVGYVEKSRTPNQKCGKCSMFMAPKFGGPGCTLVQSPIEEGGWCRQFKKGSLNGR